MLRKTTKPAKRVAPKAAPAKAKATKAVAAKAVAPKNEKPPSKNGRPAKPAAPSPVSEAQAQYTAFERAIGLFNKRNYREAKELFEKARQGPSREIASNAA